MAHAQHAASFKYFSEILGAKVTDGTGRALGRVHDMLAGLPAGDFPYPPVRGLVLRHGRQELFLPAEAIKPEDFAAGRLISASDPQPLRRPLTNHDFLVREVLLDKQIVDVDGAKVERVNDVHMLLTDRPWIVHVDVGLTGLLRRLGVENGARRLTRGVLRREMRDDLVNWKMVQPLAETEGAGRIRLKVEHGRMKELHPGEVADILEELDRDERMAVVHSLGAEVAADVLEETGEDIQTKIFNQLDPETAADIIEQMDPAEAVDILGQLRKERSTKIIAAMEQAERQQIQELISYSDDTAGGIMTNEFIRLHAKATVGQALDELRALAGEIDMIYYIYVVNGAGRLIGVVSIRELLRRERAETLESLMTSRVVSVTPEVKVPEVAELFQKYSFLACPVVDQRGHLIGVISLRNSFDELLPHFDTEAA